MQFTLYDHLEDETKRRLNAAVHRPPKKKKHKNQEKLSRREWEDVMGTKRDRYHKVNGKVRRK